MHIEGFALVISFAFAATRIGLHGTRRTFRPRLLRLRTASSTRMCVQPRLWRSKTFARLVRRSSSRSSRTCFRQRCRVTLQCNNIQTCRVPFVRTGAAQILGRASLGHRCNLLSTLQSLTICATAAQLWTGPICTDDSVCTTCVTACDLSLQVHDRLYDRTNPAAELPLVLDDKMLITEGIGCVLSQLPADQCIRALQRICMPVVTPIYALAHGEQPTLPVNMSALQYLWELLDVLTATVRYVKTRPLPADAPGTQNPIVALITSVWPSFELLFKRHVQDSKTMEKLCRCCKYAIRSADVAFSPLVPVLLQAVVTCCVQRVDSSFVYCLSVVVGIFGRHEEHRPVLQYAMHSIVGACFHALQGADSFAQSPDVVEDLFNLFTRCLKHCPSFLVRSFFRTLRGTS